MRSCRYNNERKKKSTTKNTNETFISWSINVWMHLRTEHTFSILYPHRLRVNDKHRQTPVFSPKLINNHTVARISQLPCDSHSFHRSSRSFSLSLRLSHTVSVRKHRVQVKYNQNIGFVLFCFVCPSSHVWMCVVSWCCFTRLKSERHRIDNIKIFSGVGKLNGTALGERCVCRDVLCIIKEAARGRKMCTQNQTYETNKTDRNEMATTTTTPPELWHGIRIHPNPIETPYEPKNTIIFRPFSVSHTQTHTQSGTQKPNSSICYNRNNKNKHSPCEIPFWHSNICNIFAVHGLCDRCDAIHDAAADDDDDSVEMLLKIVCITWRAPQFSIVLRKQNHEQQFSQLQNHSRIFLLDDFYGCARMSTKQSTKIDLDVSSPSFNLLVLLENWLAALARRAMYAMQFDLMIPPKHCTNTFGQWIDRLFFVVSLLSIESNSNILFSHSRFISLIRPERIPQNRSYLIWMWMLHN